MLELLTTLRSLLRSRVSTALILITLAVSSAGVITLFAIADAVFLQPLPYSDPQDLVLICSTNERWRYLSVSYSDYRDWQRRSSSFEGMAAAAYLPAEMVFKGVQERLDAERVTRNFFDVLGVSARYGRTFAPDDVDVTVTSLQFATAHFGQPAKALGQTIQINGQFAVIIGVLPGSFEWNLRGRLDLWLIHEHSEERRKGRALEVIARLKPGSMQRAQAEIDAIAGRLAREYPKTNAGIGARIVPLRARRLGDLRLPVQVILLAGGLLVLVSCLNVAAILIGRVVRRRPEALLREALGSSRAWSSRRAAVEGAVLAVVGAAAGLLISVALLDPIKQALPTDLQRLDQVAIGPRTLLFAAAMVLAMALLTTVLPTWSALRSAGRLGGDAKRESSYLDLIVVGEAFLGVVLLVCAALLLQSFKGLDQQDLGFNADGLYTLLLDLPIDRGPDSRTNTAALMTSLENELASLPGVIDVAAGIGVPLSGWYSATKIVLPSGDTKNIPMSIITNRYFQAVGIRKSEGQVAFSDRLEAVLSESLAHRLFPDRSAIGKIIRIKRPKGIASLRIIGVVGDVRSRSPRNEDAEMLYVSFAQFPNFYAMAVLRLSPRVPVSITVLRKAVARVSNQVVPGELKSIAQLKAELLAQERLLTILFSSFGVVSWVLVITAVFGIVRLWTLWRVREIGIRLATGSSPNGIVRLFLRRVAGFSIVGILMGLGLTLVLARYLETWLYQLEATDAFTYSAVTGCVLLTAVLGAVLPAFTASRLNPVSCLRPPRE